MSQVFVPSENGFVEKQINVEKKTIANTAKFLGYNAEQYYTYRNPDDEGIWLVGFKSFTDKIIFIVMSDTSKILTNDRINEYLSKYDYSKVFGSSEIESTLNDGVKNKSLSSKFLSEIFNENNLIQNGEINAESIGYTLTIKNGYLIEYKSLDGFNKWAKEWKEKFIEMYFDYRNEASKYWGDNNEKVITEMNVQAEAWAKTPNCMQNEFIELHKNENGVINFKMLLVAHYNEKITLDEFKEINHGRYELISDFSNSENKKMTTYKVGKTLFSFTEDGKFISSYTANY